jgi:hypothetical protein
MAGTRHAAVAFAIRTVGARSQTEILQSANNGRTAKARKAVNWMSASIERKA